MGHAGAVDWTGSAAVRVSGTTDVIPTVHTDLPALEQVWRTFEAEADGSPFHRFDCVSAWLRHVGHRRGETPLVVTGRTDGRLAYLLPLVVARSGPFRVVRFLGDRHANHNTGLLAPGFDGLDEAGRIALVKAIGEARPDADLLHLDGQPATVAGRPNPFLFDRSIHSGYTAWEIDLDGGFAGVLERHRGGKKRKRHRQQQRAFEGAGEVRLSEAATAADAARIVEAFGRQKAERFADQGVPNVFAEPGILDFFQEMLGSDGPASTGFRAFYLEVAGEIRATFFTTENAVTRFGLMNSIALDDLMSHSPGEFLIHHLLADTAERGFRRFDFGIGDARYKRSWVDRSYPLYETLLPLTLGGTLAVAACRLRRGVRERIVASPRLYAMAQRARSWAGARTRPADEPERDGDE